MKYRQVDIEVSTATVKTMFPFYTDRARVRGYFAKKCTDELVTPFIYPFLLATHHRWPQKDEFPLYFCKQLFTKFHLQHDVDYTDYLGHVGQGLGRLSKRFRPVDTPMPLNKWAMVGPNLLVMLRGRQMVIVGESVLDDTIKTQIYLSIATIATQLQEISLDQCGRYMLQYRGTISTTTSSSTSFDDAYGVVDIPSPLEVYVVSNVDALHCLGSYLPSDLLDAY